MARATAFGTAAAVTGVVFYGSLGALGSVGGIWVERVFQVVALGILLGSFAWYVRWGVNFPGSRRGRQANRRRAQRGLRGSIYFGAVLGPGVLTEAATPLVLLGVALSVGYGLTWSAGYGLGFAAGRSAASWTGVVLGGRDVNVNSVVHGMLALPRHMRWLGIATTVAALTLGVFVSLPVFAA